MSPKKKNRPHYLRLPRPFHLRDSSSGHKTKLIATIVLAAGIFIFGIYALFFSDYFIINTFEVEEDSTIIDPNEELKSILQKTLGQNLILLNTSAVRNSILENHPEIEHIQINKVWPHSLKVSYQKYKTVANIVNIIEGIQKKFLVDSEGLLIEENNEQPYLPYIYLQTTESLEVQQPLLNDPQNSKDRLTYTLQAINLFEEKFNIKILYAELKPREREVHLMTENRFIVMIDMQKDLARQIEKLQKAREILDISKEPLLYVDLRISGVDNEKVIFKRK